MTLEGSNIPSGSSMIFRFPARLEDARLLGISVHALFQNLGFDKMTTYQLELAIIESANNIVKHAKLAKNKAQINMKFAVVSNKVVCTFVDQGKPIDFLLKNSQEDTCTYVSQLPVSKRGLAIVCEVMDTVSYKRTNGKNVLTLVKYLSN